MHRRKRLRGLFVSSDGISIRRLREAPPIIPGLAYPWFVRVSLDQNLSLCFYEQASAEPLSLAAAFGRERIRTAPSAKVK